MKKFIKKCLFYFVLGGIVLGIIPAFSAVSYNSSKIRYSNTNSKLKSTTISGALDELINKIKYGDATASDIQSGRKSLVNGKLITGTSFMPTPDSIYYKVYSQSTDKSVTMTCDDITKCANVQYMFYRYTRSSSVNVSYMGMGVIDLKNKSIWNMGDTGSSAYNASSNASSSVVTIGNFTIGNNYVTRTSISSKYTYKWYVIWI